MARKPNPYRIDAENPEITAKEMATARPAIEALMEQGLLRRRGKQKTPTKELVSIRLDHDLVAAMKATGQGWQTRANATLRASMMSKPAVKRSAIKKSSKGGRPRKEAR